MCTACEENCRRQCSLEHATRRCIKCARASHQKRGRWGQLTWGWLATVGRVNLEACLPPWFGTATVRRIAAGMSGGGVYRVGANGRAYVLKVSGDMRALGVQRAAAAAELAPAIVHVDEARGAIVS